MIIPNGYITVRTSIVEEKDSNGYPLPPVESWSEPIPCQFILGSNLQARNDGEAMAVRSYTIFIEGNIEPCEVIKLHARGISLGRFSVRSFEPLDAVCQTRITV